MAKVYSKYSETEPNKERELMTVRAEILKKRFLELYMMTAHVGKTCEILGMVRRTVYHWKQTDEQFRKDFEMADKVALSVLEDEATRRATYGVEKPVYQGGKLVGWTREYSDTLLIVLLKARAPHKYKERFAGELTGADGKPLLPEAKIIHVHSNVPLASSEDTIDQNSQLIEYKEIKEEDVDDLI